MTQNDWKWDIEQNCKNGSEWLKMTQYDSKWPRNGSEWFRMTQNELKWLKMTQNDL